MVLLYAGLLCFRQRPTSEADAWASGARANMVRSTRRRLGLKEQAPSAAAAVQRPRGVGDKPPSRGGVTKLAILSCALRLGLSAMAMSAAWQLISLSEPLGGLRWVLVAPAIVAVTSILFAEALDFEAAAANRALRGAVFAPDRWGGRAETVRAHAQEYVRIHGRRPNGTCILHDIYAGDAFTVVYGKTDPSQ
jgi:hypothetical protein